MLHAAQMLPMGLQPSGARPDAPADKAGAAEAFGALLAADDQHGERAQAQDKPASRSKAAADGAARSEAKESTLSAPPEGTPEGPAASAPDTSADEGDVGGAAPEGESPAPQADLISPLAADGPAESEDSPVEAEPRPVPEPPAPESGAGPAAAGDDNPRALRGESRPAQDIDLARAASQDDQATAQDPKPAADAKAAVDGKTGSTPDPAPAERQNGSEAQDARPRDGEEKTARPARPAPPLAQPREATAPTSPAPGQPETDGGADAEAETAAARAEAPAGQAAAQAADGEAVSRAAAQTQTEDTAPRRERLAAAHVRGEGESRAERASGDPAPSRSAERPQPSSAQPSPAQPQPQAQPAPQPQPGAQAQAAAPLFAHPAGMRPGAEPMPVRASEPAPEALTDAARIERAAADPARSPASQLQGQPHGPRLVPGHAAAMAGLMARRFSDGARVFDIRLDPAELGRVDVRMTMGKDGKAQVLMTAERAEALAELQRTHRELARELEEAGVELAEDGLSFELASGDDGDRTGPDADAPGWIPLTVAGAAADEAGPASAPRLYGFALHARSGVDVRA